MKEFGQLGQFLKTAREGHGFTQKQVAEAMKVHFQFVSNWERGMCAPPTHCFQNLISFLKLNRQDLISVMVEDSRSDIHAKIFKKRKIRIS